MYLSDNTVLYVRFLSTVESQETPPRQFACLAALGSSSLGSWGSLPPRCSQVWVRFVKFSDLLEDACAQKVWPSTAHGSRGCRESAASPRCRAGGAPHLRPPTAPGAQAPRRDVTLGTAVAARRPRSGSGRLPGRRGYTERVAAVGGRAVAAVARSIDSQAWRCRVRHWGAGDGRRDAGAMSQRQVLQGRPGRPDGGGRTAEPAGGARRSPACVSPRSVRAVPESPDPVRPDGGGAGDQTPKHWDAAERGWALSLHPLRSAPLASPRPSRVSRVLPPLQPRSLPKSPFLVAPGPPLSLALHRIFPGPSSPSVPWPRLKSPSPRSPAGWAVRELRGGDGGWRP